MKHFIVILSLFVSGLLSGVEKSLSASSYQFAPGQFTLHQGQSVGDDHVFLTYQKDGNLVVYVDYKPVWQSATGGSCASCFVNYQGDGNFVIYNGSTPLWLQGWYGSSSFSISDQAPFLFPNYFKPTSSISLPTRQPTQHPVSATVRPLASVGFNEQFILGYARSQGYQCPYWSGTNVTQCENSEQIPFSAVQSYLDALIANGIKVHRDIVPIKFFIDPNNLYHIITVMKEYQKRGMTLIFVPGFPMPGPLAQNGLICVPGDEREFEKLAYQISNYTVDLFKRLRNSGQLDSNWLNQNVIIEPLNEFDGISGINPDGTCEHNTLSHGTPAKAKILQAVMAYVFWKQEFRNEITAPSIVNVYHGVMSEAPRSKYDTMRIYLKDYYAAGGSGRPSIHLYYGPVPNPQITSPELIEDLAGGVQNLLSAIPDQYRNKILVGETGIPEQSAYCKAAGIPEYTRIGLNQGLVQNPIINQHVEYFIFWRLAKVSPVAPSGHVLGDCESTFGVVPAAQFRAGFQSWDDFGSAGKGLFEALRYRAR